MDSTMESATTETKTYKEGQLIKGKDFIRLESPLVLPSKNTPLLTNAQDLVGAINELKKGLDEGGGDDKWVRPTDWPAISAPEANQIKILISTQWNTSPYESFYIYSYKQGTTAKKFDGTTTASVDWGDGFVETIALPNTVNNVSSGHYFFDTSNGTWNDGPILNNGAHVFVITVTLPDNAYISVEYLNCEPLEIYVGKNVKFYSVIVRNQEMLEHVKFFDWQPSGENNAGDSYGILSNNYVLQKVDATEPLNRIPARAFSDCHLLSEVDLSACTEIAEYGLYNTDVTQIASDTLNTLGDNGLSNCYQLQKVSTPNLSVISGRSAFANSYNITDVIIADNCTYPSGTFSSQYKWYDNPEKHHPEFN